MITVKGEIYTEEYYEKMIKDFFDNNKTIYCESYKCRMTEEECEKIKDTKINEAQEISEFAPGHQPNIPCLTCKKNETDVKAPEYKTNLKYKICRFAEEYPEKCPSEKDGIPGKFYINASYASSTWRNTIYCCDECRMNYGAVKNARKVFRKNNIKIVDIDPEQIFSEQELVRFLQVAKRTVARWRQFEYIVPFESINGKRGFKYTGRTLIDFMEYLKLD